MRPPLVLPVLALAACMTGLGDRASHRTADRLGLALADIDLLKTKKGLSDDEMLAMPRPALDSLLQRLHGVRPDHPSEAEQHRLISLKNERGEIPHDALM